MHMAHITPFVDQLKHVLAALSEEDRRRRQKDPPQNLRQFTATADFPGVAFIDDLMDMYPDAQIILNGRKSGQEWADSIQNSSRFRLEAVFIYLLLNVNGSSAISGTSCSIRALGEEIWDSTGSAIVGSVLRQAFCVGSTGSSKEGEMCWSSSRRMDGSSFVDF